jgi:hypothetical protein
MIEAVVLRNNVRSTFAAAFAAVNDFRYNS